MIHISCDKQLINTLKQNKKIEVIVISDINDIDPRKAPELFIISCVDYQTGIVVDAISFCEIAKQKQITTCVDVTLLVGHSSFKQIDCEIMIMSFDRIGAASGISICCVVEEYVNFYNIPILPCECPAFLIAGAFAAYCDNVDNLKTKNKERIDKATLIKNKLNIKQNKLTLYNTISIDVSKADKHRSNLLELGIVCGGGEKNLVFNDLTDDLFNYLMAEKLITTRTS
jgi:hypothetical protein